MKSKSLDKQREEWSKYLHQQDRMMEFIEENTINLSMDSDGEYIRKINYTSNKDTLKIIEENLGKLEKFYKKINDNKKLHQNFPVILKGVENINININSATKSFPINRLDKEKLDKTLTLCTFETNVEPKTDPHFLTFYKLQEKYHLRFSFITLFRTIGYGQNKKSKEIKLCFVKIKYKDLLDLTNTNKLQIHISTGNQYILNVRKVGENRSKRYRYGFVILDKEARINKANKEAKRTHCLENTLEKYEFPFPTICKIYIKEKKGIQMNIF